MVNISDMYYGAPNVMKRLKGTEILIIGCYSHFAIVEHKNGSLYHLSTLRDVHDGPICDFVFAKTILYSKAANENQIKITKFGNNPGAESADPGAKDPNAVNNSRVPQSPSIHNSSANPRSPTIPPSQRNNLNKSHLQQIFDFSNPRINKIKVENFKDLEKVMVSENGNKLYAGGKGLHIFERRNGVYTPLAIDRTGGNFKANPANPFFSIRSTPSGHVLLQVPVTNDLRVVSSVGKEITRHNGLQRLTFSKF